MRSPRVLCLLALLLGITCCPFRLPAQVSPSTPDLASIVRQLPAHPYPTSPAFFEMLDHAAQAATPPEMERQIPVLLSYLQAPRAPERGLALLALLSLASRQHPDRTVDTTGAALLAPYLDLLAPHLHDPDPPTRNMTLFVLQALGVLRPTPPALQRVLLNELQRPDATTPLPSSDPQSLGYPPTTHFKPTQALGPEILAVLLPADATFARDPATGISEGKASPKVQAAVIDFLNRKDQTADSLAETIRVLSLQQPQSPEVNAAVAAFLNSGDPVVVRALLSCMNRFTLSPEVYATTRNKVRQIAANQDAPVGERTLATRLLGCWHNNRHAMCDPSMQP